MSVIYTARCRVTQMFVRIGKRRLAGRKQYVATGAGSLFDLGQILRDQQVKKPMVVLGAGTERAGEKLLQLLAQEDVGYTVWQELSATPTAADVERLHLAVQSQNCDGIIVLGDGSEIDAAKIAAARSVSGGLSVMEMVGRRRLPRRKVPPVVAIPSVGGSGAESVYSAVIADETKNRFVIEGAALLPAVAILDPELTEDATRDQVADAGLDGLCRAVEAYLAASPGDKKTKIWAAQAVEKLFDSLEQCWNSGGSVKERGDMLSASRLGARAFSTVGGGYVRAMILAAQSVCAVSFREACATIMPTVLEKYGISAEDTLAELAERIGMAPESGRNERSAAVIGRIRGMIFRMGLPDALEGVNADQVEEIADLTAAANFRSVSPVVWSAAECRDVVLSACAKPDGKMNG